MKKLIREPVKMQILVLVIVFLAAFSVIYGIYMYVEDVMNDYNDQINNNSAESQLGKILSGKLYIIENSFSQIANSDKISNVDIHEEIVKESLSKIKEILNILQNGGAYSEVIPVNIIGRDTVSEVIIYKRADKSYVIEVIELTPKIVEIENSAQMLIELVKGRYDIYDQMTLNKLEKRIDIIVKLTETQFKRSHESVNKIFYDTTLKNNRISVLKERSYSKLEMVKYGIILFTVLIVSLLTFIIVKKISSLLREREDHLTKIQENNQTIQRIFDVVPVGIAIIDKEKKIRRVNKKALELFKTDNIQDIKWSDCRRCFDVDSETSCPFDDSIPLNEIEVFLINSLGDRIPILKNVMPIQINNEEFLLEAFMDLTEQKEVEKQLKIAKEKAEESNNLKSAFLANMSHEIRTPMNGILGFAQFLAKPEISQEQLKKFSDIIISSGNHLMDILNDIIDVAKIESGQLKLNIENVNINDLMREMHTFFTTYISQKGNSILELNLNLFTDDNDAYIQTDRTRVKQILTNLLNNAVKFTDKGNIIFGYKIADQELNFYVKDSGIGIPPDKQQLIFERFNQVGDTNDRLYGGTGLGLTISKACVELLGGKIWLESELDRGTTFYFTIPFEKGKSKQNAKSNEIVYNDYSRAKVLIVEDDLVNFNLMKEILEIYKLNLIHTETAEEAVEIVNEQDDIDLIFMDIQLPGKDGNYATREIKKINPGIPVIVQTAYVFNNDEILSREAGCDEYITKPVNINKIVDLLTKYLGSVIL